MHPQYLTPTFATVVMGAISAIFFVGLTSVSKNVLADSASSVGLLIAFYYGLTGFACVWFFRRDLTTSARDFVFKGLLPGIGGLVLLGAFVLSIKSYLPAGSSATSLWGMGEIFVIGATSLLVGVVLMFITKWRSPTFFSGTVLNRHTPVRSLSAVPDAVLSLPDSASHERAIVPPLSVSQLAAVEAAARHADRDSK